MNNLTHTLITYFRSESGSNAGFRMRPNSALVLHAVTKIPDIGSPGSGSSSVYIVPTLLLVITVFTNHFFSCYHYEF